MLIVRRPNSVSFISDYWVAFIFFLLSLTSTLLVKKFLNKRKKKMVKSTNNVRGGDGKIKNIVDVCLSKEGLYTVTDSKVANIIRRLLGISEGSGPVVVSIGLYTLALIKSMSASRIINIGTTQVILAGTSRVLGQALMGTVTGFFIANSLQPAAIIGLIIALSAAPLIDVVSCNSHVSQLKQVEAAEKVILLPESSEVFDDVYVTSDESYKFYKPYSAKVNQCNIETLGGKLYFKAQSSVRDIKCIKNKQYIPLSQRTKTLQDLKKENTYNSDAAEIVEAEIIANSRNSQNQARIKELDDFIE